MNNGNNGGNMYNMLNNININGQNNPSDRRDRRVPVKLIKKDEMKKDSGSNFGVNNVNINGNILNKEKEKQKLKELNQKINEFDLKLNPGDVKKPNTPSDNNKNKEIVIHQKRPSTPAADKDSKNKKTKVTSNEENEECLLDEFMKYNLNKKIINEKFKENPNIRMVENSPMVIPKNNKPTPSIMKSTNIFLNDDKSSTKFFKDLMNSDFHKILNNNNADNLKLDNFDINNFVNDLNRKSNYFGDIGYDTGKDFDYFGDNKNKKVTISDFVVSGKENENEKVEKLNKYIEDMMKNSNLVVEKDKKDKILSSNIKIKSKSEEPHLVPLCDKDMNLNFQVCYEDNDSQQNYINTNPPSYFKNDNSGIKSTTANVTDSVNVTNKQTEEDSCEQVSDQEDNEGNCSRDEEDDFEDDEEGIEAVENVSVIRDLKGTSSATEKAESNQQQVEMENRQQIVSR